jgi:hypothetical protein
MNTAFQLQRETVLGRAANEPDTLNKGSASSKPGLLNAAVAMIDRAISASGLSRYYATVVVLGSASLFCSCFHPERVTIVGSKEMSFSGFFALPRPADVGVGQ